MRLAGKVVVVTGASKGIGRALVGGLAAEGAAVVATYRSDSEGAESLVEETARAGAGSVSAVRADISRLDDVRSVFRTVAERHGRLDALVNNAATTGWGGVFDVDEELWDTIVDTNLKGTFFCSVEAARLMRAGEGGRS